MLAHARREVGVGDVPAWLEHSLCARWVLAWRRNEEERSGAEPREGEGGAEKARREGRRKGGKKPTHLDHLKPRAGCTFILGESEVGGELGMADDGAGERERTK